MNHRIASTSAVVKSTSRSFMVMLTSDMNFGRLIPRCLGIHTSMVRSKSRMGAKFVGVEDPDPGLEETLLGLSAGQRPGCVSPHEGADHEDVPVGKINQPQSPVDH